jgi:DNA-binding CsgD family transcriptional regulator
VSSTGQAGCTTYPGDVGERLGELARQLGEQIAAGTANDETASHLFVSLGRVQVGVADAMVNRRLEPRVAGAICRLVGALQEDLTTRVHRRRSLAFERIQEFLIAVSRDAGTAQLIERAPAALCDACGFDRAAISLLRGAVWSPVAFHVANRTDPGCIGDAPSVLADVEVRLLRLGLSDTELIRRRRPILVENSQADSKTFNPSAEPLGFRGYVAAPVVADGRVIGLLHADTLSPGRLLSSLDRDLIKVFADGFGVAYERVALAERMEQQRAHLALAFSSMGSVIGELQSAAVRLTRFRTGATVELASPTSWPDARGTDHGVLTRREHEILALMATGSTNVQIATRLFVSESTIKSHVKRVLRKLPAKNRAEAVYQYKCMTTAKGEQW